MNAAILPRILPFILFMSFIGMEEVAHFLNSKGLISLSEDSLLYLYPLKTFSVAYIIFLFRKSYHEVVLHQLFSLRNLTASVMCGLIVFVLWINMDFSINSFEARQGFNPLIFNDLLLRNFMIVVRLSGAVLVVPFMEELFWRSFFLRYIVNPDFSKVPLGRFTWPSFLLTSLLFGLEHNLIAAGIMAGVAYNLLLYFTRSISHCILAHAITNLLLGIYVLVSHKWYFW